MPIDTDLAIIAMGTIIFKGIAPNADHTHTISSGKIGMANKIPVVKKGLVDTNFYIIKICYYFDTFLRI